jgi:polysaccharide chain length determinant protein (PEP-CTERM system associated)
MSGRRHNITIGFRISYESPHPDQAQKVVDEVVSLYLSENAKVRQEGIAKTTAFLSQEAERIGRQIQDIEANLAEFKKRNADRLPETATATSQLVERTQSELARVERDIGLAQDRKMSLEAQLALIDPRLPPPVSGPAGERVMTPEQKLRALEAQYATQSAMYHEEHPDIRRTKREIEALKVEIASGGSLERDAGNNKSQASRPSSSRPDNPAYIVLLSQIESAKREIAQLAATRDDLRARQRTYDARLLAIPELEREYRDLTRDYDNAQTRYRDIKAKLMQAEVAQELEKDSKAERFTLGEPATLPTSPVRPNRPMIAVMGLAGSLGAGVGLAFTRDALSGSIKGPGELARIARLPVLTPIPYIRTQRERTGRRRQALILSALVASLAALALLGLHILFDEQPQIMEAVARLPIWR